MVFFFLYIFISERDGIEPPRYPQEQALDFSHKRMYTQV